jgi:transcription elongation GreA/GreB family factor
MNDSEKIKLKIELKQKAIEILRARIDASAMAVHEAQAAANEEGRSSVGDKYETGRAMAHIDRDIHARQLDAAQKELAFIQNADVKYFSKEIKTGAFAETNQGKYFFLCGLGSVDFNNEKIFYLSINSPIGQCLQGKATGDKVPFSGREINILSVF